MDKEKTQAFVDENYEKLFVNPLMEFVKVDNLTLMFDPEYLTNGKLDKAIAVVRDFAADIKIDGLSFHEYKEPGRVPMVAIVVEGASKLNVMVYGHLDK